MENKKFWSAPIISVIIVIGLGIFLLIFMSVSNFKNSNKNLDTSVNEQVNSIDQKIVDTTGWVTFTDESLGISYKHPADSVINGAGPGIVASNMVSYGDTIIKYVPLNYSYAIDDKMFYANMSLPEVAAFVYNKNKYDDNPNIPSDRFISSPEQVSHRGYQFIIDWGVVYPCFMINCINSEKLDGKHKITFLGLGDRKLLINSPLNDPIADTILETFIFNNYNASQIDKEGLFNQPYGTGVIKGQISLVWAKEDQQPVASEKINVTNTKTSEKFIYNSNNDGSYSVILPPGQYQLCLNENDYCETTDLGFREIKLLNLKKPLAGYEYYFIWGTPVTEKINEKDKNILGNGYFIYKNQVYYSHSEIVENLPAINYTSRLDVANLSSFVLLGEICRMGGCQALAKDDVYIYSGAAVETALMDQKVDVKTFVRIKYDFFKDKNYVYYHGQRFAKLDFVDLNTFEILNEVYSKDKNNVYKNMEGFNIIEGADPKTFVVPIN